jgi:hypothetical protein
MRCITIKIPVRIFKIVLVLLNIEFIAEVLSLTSSFLVYVGLPKSTPD